MGMKCCERPHGNNVFGAMLFTTIAFILSNSGTRWCDYAYREFKAQDSDFPFLLGSTQVGLHSYEVAASTCVYYPSYVTSNGDTRLKTAQVFAIWTTTMGGIILIFLWFSSCYGMSRSSWVVIGFFLMVNSLFEGLTLLFMTSAICDPAYATCTLARGSRCGISAIVFWFLAGASVATVPPPERPAPAVIQETTTTTETVNPDGTKTTTTTTERHTVPGV